jgi:hypothetical protein
MNSLGPIEQGWRIVLDEAPNRKERAKAESFRGIFYGGASWLWVMVKDKFDDEFLRGLIEQDFERWRKERRKQ